MKPSPTTSDIYSLWTIQDSLLQYYRTIFITAQSVLLSVAVSVSAGKEPKSAIVLMIVGLSVLFVWVVVTWSRARDVSFAQHIIARHEIGKEVPGLFNTFKDYQRIWRHKRSYQFNYADGSSETFVPESNFPDISEIFQPWRWGTRPLLEFFLPAVFLFCWIFIVSTLVKSTSPLI